MFLLSGICTSSLKVIWSGQFFLLPQLSKEIIIASKVVKSDSKIIISLCQSKSLTHFLEGKRWVFHKWRHTNRIPRQQKVLKWIFFSSKLKRICSSPLCLDVRWYGKNRNRSHSLVEEQERRKENGAVAFSHY